MSSITLRAGLQIIYTSIKEKEMGKELCILIKLVRGNDKSYG
jgi:hypothetical protein